MKYNNAKENWDWSTDANRCDHDLEEKYQKAIDAALEELESAKKEYDRMKMKFDKAVKMDRKERESEKKRAKEMWEFANKDDDEEKVEQEPEEKVEQKPEEKVEQKPDNEKEEEQKPDESMMMSLTMPASMGGATQYFNLENANNVTVNIEERGEGAGKDA